MTENAYIHIPFCVKKCNYCAFVSYNKLQKKKDYIKSLIAEIKSNYNGERLNTLYFGGGTPSLLSIDEVEEIISLFQFANNAEVSFEVNPNKLSVEYLTKLYKLGVNRLSIGAQSFDSGILKLIGRLHTPEDITKAVENARLAGFGNISIDLIYGLPTQTLENFEKTLNSAIELGVEHISLYGLKIEENTPFAQKPPLNLPDDDMQADMYLLAGDVLRFAGFNKYEISNFSKIGFESKHNLNYWDANTYYGFGCGAHGYEFDSRYENEIDLDKYIQNPFKKIHNHLLTEEEKREETIFLGFRKAEGIDVKEIKEKFGYDFDSQNGASIVKFLDSGHVIKTDKGYALSDKGFLVSNVILCQFING